MILSLFGSQMTARAIEKRLEAERKCRGYETLPELMRVLLSEAVSKG